MIRLRLTIIAIITAVFLAGGYHIKELRTDNRDLSAQVEQLETIREAENGHIVRELARQEALNNLKLEMGELNVQAEKDTSDAGSMFGASRLRRLDSIR